jgi:hypothetical protein
MAITHFHPVEQLLDEDDLETCRKSTNIKNAFDRIEIL